MRLLSYEDTRRMLDNTVVCIRGRLAICVKVGLNLEGVFVCCETGERFTELCDMDVLQNPKDSRIGYANRDQWDAVYLVRQASRVYKMGFAYDNMAYLKNGELSRWATRSMGTVLQGLQEAYDNNYPTFEEALAKSQKDRKIVAYDRSFAISPAGTVLYQSRMVGMVRGPHEADIRWEEGIKPISRQRPQLNWRK